MADSFLLGSISTNGRLVAVPLSTGGLPEARGRKPNVVVRNAANDLNKGPAFSEAQCGAFYVLIGVTKVRVDCLTGNQVEQFIRGTLEKMYPWAGTRTDKYRDLTADIDVWNMHAKWWMLLEMKRLVDMVNRDNAKQVGKKYNPIQLFV
jgi:hypothetical protein